MKKTKPDITQIGLLAIFERISRSHPFFYIISREIAFRLNIFEREFDGLKRIIFKKKKINFVDVGASDGIAIKYISKFIKLDKVYAFEPNYFFYKKICLLKKKIKNLKVFNYGLSDKNQNVNLYVPKFSFFNKNFYMYTYAFYNKKELRENLNTNYTLKNNIKIVKTIFKSKKIKKFPSKIDLLKIDVNGHEFNVLKGLTTMIGKDNPVVILEELKNILKIKKFLGQFGYICYTYDPKKRKFLKYNNKNSALNYYFMIKKKHEFTNI